MGEKNVPDEEHYRKLERMYLAAPINEYYRPSITVADGEAHIEIAIRKDFWHAAEAVHGSVYFKAMDDAAYFAVNSRFHDAFALTTSFNVYFTRPVSQGVMRAVGRIVHAGKNLFVAEAELFNEQGGVIGRGSGAFVKSKIPLSAGVGYK